MSDDIKSMVGQVGAALKDFRNQYDGQLAELHERLDENEARLNRKGLGGAAGGAGRDAGCEDAKAFFSAVHRRAVESHEVDTEALSGYEKAFPHFLRRGIDAVSPQIRNDLSVAADPEGGFWVPPEMAREITQRTFDTSAMREIATVRQISSDALEIPLAVNDATAGGWVAEKASRPATDTPDVGMQRITAHEQYAMPQVTQKLLDDSMFDVEAWLNGEIADKLSRDENLAFVSGNGVDRPRGFLDYSSTAVTTDDASRDWGVLQYVATGASADFPNQSGVTGATDAGPLFDLISKLKAVYRRNSTWLMNRATASRVRKMKDADGRYLWTDSLQLGQPANLLGFPVREFEDMPDLASDSFSIALGDFQRGYLIADRTGVRVLRDPFTNKPFVRFYATKRVGGDVRDFDAIKLLKFGVS